MWSSRIGAGAARAVSRPRVRHTFLRPRVFERTLIHHVHVLSPTSSLTRVSSPVKLRPSPLCQVYSFSSSAPRTAAKSEEDPVIIPNVEQVLSSRSAPPPPTDPITSSTKSTTPGSATNAERKDVQRNSEPLSAAAGVGGGGSSGSGNGKDSESPAAAAAAKPSSSSSSVRGPQRIPANLIDARAIAGGLPRVGDRVKSNAPKDPAGYFKMIVNFPRVAAVKTVEFLKAVARILSSPTLLREKSIAAWGGIKHEAKRFYHGTRLLMSDVNAAISIASRRIRGHQLTRREYKQLTRTIADIFRMVPFSIMIIVPFLEFLLPVALAMFPGMLPSTFQEKHKEAEKVKKQLALRLDLAKFVVDTLGDMASDMKNKDGGNEQAANLAKLLDKVRAGEVIDNDSLISVAKLFEDDITIDSLSREQLQEMCRYMGLRPYGSDIWLRTHLLRKFREIKADDVQIATDGLDSLSAEEVKAACRDRGMKASGLSEFQQRHNLASWLDLSLNHQLPPSLLILSRPFTMAQRFYDPESTTRDAGQMIAQAIANLDEGAVDEVRVEKMFVADIAKEREVLMRKAELIAQERKDKEEYEKRKQELKAAQAAADGDNAEEIAKAAAAEKEKKKSKTEAARIITEALADFAATSGVSREKDELEILRTFQETLHNQIEAKILLEEEAAAAAEAAKEATDAAVAAAEAASPEAAAAAAADKKAEELVDTAEPLTTPAAEEIVIPKSEELPVERQPSKKSAEETEQELIDKHTKEDEKQRTKNMDRLEKRLVKMLDKIQAEVAEADEKIGDKLSILKDKSEGLSYDEVAKLVSTELSVSLSREDILEVIEKMDKKHDGKIDMDELKATVDELIRLEHLDTQKDASSDSSKSADASKPTDESKEESK